MEIDHYEFVDIESATSFHLFDPSRVSLDFSPTLVTLSKYQLLIL